MKDYSANQKENYKQNKRIRKPTEGKCFKVNPKLINKELFSESREDSRQEATRQVILKAFIKVSKEPEKYANPFKTMIPEKTWSSKTVKELEEFANNLGDHIADWVEQALEWAQRIQNGETWEDICNKPDSANWHRLIIWDNGFLRCVGGACKSNVGLGTSVISRFYCNSNTKLDDAVPLVVFYD